MNPSQYFSVIVFEIRHSIIESVRTPAPIQTVPYGTVLLGGAVQALRARLRSHRPSGTKAFALS
jgi:hypothetical protein